MTTNGDVPGGYLINFEGIQVAACIYPDLKACAAQFRERYTFGIVAPGGGYRPADMQVAMQEAYDAGQYNRAPWWLSAPPSPRPANKGSSRHGFGKAIDVVSNAPVATRDAILAAHNFRLWTVSDRNHYEWGDALSSDGLVTAASLGLKPASNGITQLIDAEENMTYALQYTVAGPELPATVALGSVFIGSGTDPLIWAGNWGPEQLNGVVPAPWNAQMIAQRISEVGIRGTGVGLNVVFASLADAMAGKNPVYTLGGPAGSGGLSATDIAVATVKAAGAALANG